MEMKITMKSGRVWNIRFNGDSSGARDLHRARETYMARMNEFAHDPELPASYVFYESFAFFRAVSCVTSIVPAPEFPAVPEARVLLLEEASALLDVWEKLLDTDAPSEFQKTG